MSFAHLHVHTEYSMLDGLSNIKKLISTAKEMGMPAVAITDHGTMFGVKEFYDAAKAKEIKPIIGLEAYMAARGMTDRDAKLDKKSSHLLLLAKNQTGYQNLLQIASAAQTEGFYYYPRIDHDFLAAHSEGLICTSGCMSAEIPRALLREDPDEAVRRMNWYYDVFGKDNFYVELQQHNIAEITDLNRQLLDLGVRYTAKYVATNDVHYIKPSDARLQDVLLAMQTGSTLNDPNRKMKVGDDPTYYLRSPEEMHKLFREVPESLSNTLEIAERCDVSLDFTEYHLPHFPVPDGHTEESYLRHLCEQGLEKRYGSHSDDKVIRDRLNYELGIIHNMGFDAYFIIVWDLVREAQKRGILYTTRGSAAGSIVAYSLEITLIDPIHHDLIFERFLNPGRISMPDIDLDFRDDRRHEMMAYCAEKYGDDKVAQIITFGTMGAKAAIRDVGRVMDIPLNEVDKIAKLIPAVSGKAVTLEETLKDIPDFKKAYNAAPHIKKLIDTAMGMEGVVRNAGTHAAGVVIADKPIVEYLPLHRPTSNSEDTPIKTVTQFEMGVLDAMGMLKVDFLGLSTLTVIARAAAQIEKRHGKKYHLENIPLDDPKAFQIIGEGNTAGIFQLEGGGMTGWMVKMQPSTLDHVIAMVALYRPGPMQFIPSYIERMNGREEVTYRHPKMEPIFKSTYGIPIYQEQIMRTSVELGGYSGPESDNLRKAISKKKHKEIARHRTKFIDGCVKNGIERDTATAIFDDWEEFARYGFNKCLPGDVEVLDAASGRLLKVEDLYSGKAKLDATLTCDLEDLRFKAGQVSAVMENGIKPIFRLATASGRIISATNNHPFYTFDGWQNLSDLNVGELIAVPRVIPIEGKEERPAHEMIALGHLLAEGNLCHPHSVYFYSQSQSEVDDYVAAANAFENVDCSVGIHRNTFSVYAKRKDKSLEPGIVLWAKALGLWGKNALEKEIPAEIFTLKNENIALMLSRMWQGDGHLNVEGRSMFYATSSERMARQLQHLHLRFGILSRLRQVTFPYKEGRIGYQLFITGEQNFAKFAKNIGKHFSNRQKKNALQTLLALEPTRVVGTKDIVPLAVKPLIRAAKENANITWIEMNRETGIAQREFYPSSASTKRGFTRETIGRVVQYFNDEEIARYADNDIYWDEIVSIEYLGEEQTYDLEVPQTHNFVANDILVHNSHAAAYGTIAVQTAFLKAHYPGEFLTALMSVFYGDTAKVSHYSANAREMGIDILPPDVNKSEWDFAIEDLPDGKQAIRFGFGAIKNVGRGPVDALIEARQEGEFTDINDFIRSVDLRAIGKRALESMVKVGALDGFGSRSSLLGSLDRIIGVSASHFKAKEAGQMSLFGAATGTTDTIIIPPGEEIDHRIELNWERELIGIYVSDHPLSHLQKEIRAISTHTSATLPEARHQQGVRVVGIIAGVRPYQTKSGKPMGFVTLDDMEGVIELVIFPRTWQQTRELCEEGNIVIIEGKADAENTPPKILVDNIRMDFDLVSSADEMPAARPFQPAPVKKAPAQPQQQIAEPAAPAYAAPAPAPKPIAAPTKPVVPKTPPPAPPPLDDDMPPMPEAFPEDWEEIVYEGDFYEAEEVDIDIPEVAEEVEAEAMPGNDEQTEDASAPAAPSYEELRALMPSLFSEDESKSETRSPRLITISLKPNGNIERDKRRLRNIHGVLISFPGQDRFSLQIFEGERGHLIDFPNDTTRICPEMLTRLKTVLGNEQWRIEEIGF